MASFEALQQTLTQLDRVEGVTVVDIMKLPPPLDVTLKRMLKEPLSVDALATDIQLPVDRTCQIMDTLIDKGFVKTEEQSDVGGRLYKVYFARMRKHNLPDNLFDAM